jgi:hypothetical protein
MLTQEKVKRLMTLVKDRRLELLLGCDAKSHHEVWGRININSRGESLLDFNRFISPYIRYK